MRRKAFTLVELLVVIAVIAILAAILLPVFFRAKVQTKRTSDATNMASIQRALNLYKTDQGGFPPLLLQVAEYDGNILRRLSEIRRGYLYKSRVDDLSVFHSEGATDTDMSRTVQACWPTIDARATTPQETQFKGPNDLVVYTDLAFNFNPAPLNGQSPSDPAEFYAYDGYDIAPTLNPNCAADYELRYILFWTTMGQQGGGPTDNQRQLGYRDPKEDTIITWNTFFQDTDGTPAIPKRSSDTIVLMLNGTAKAVDGRDVFDRSWRYGQ